MLAQLNVSIEKKLIDKLDALKEKTKVSKKALVEQALQLLFKQYEVMEKMYAEGAVDQNFIQMTEAVMNRHDEALKKLKD